MVTKMGVEKKRTKEMKSVYVWPWHPASQGAAKLANALKVAVFNGDYMTLPMTGSTIINWGLANPLKTQAPYTIINEPRRVQDARRSKVFFAKAEKVTTVPPHTEDLGTAIAWLRDGIEVLAKASDGRWETFDDEPSIFLEARHFAQYKKKSAEFVVHVVGEKALGVEKLVPLPDSGGLPFNGKFRTKQNGFVPELTIDYPDELPEAAVDVVRVLGLTFGSVHFLWNNVSKRSYAIGYEANPVLPDELFNLYAEALKPYTT